MLRPGVIAGGVLLALAGRDGHAQTCDVRASPASLVVDVPVGARAWHRVWLTDVPTELQFGGGRVRAVAEAPVAFAGRAVVARLATARALSLHGGMVSVAGNRAFDAYRVAGGALAVDIDDVGIALSGLRVECGDVAPHDPTRHEALPARDAENGALWVSRGGALVLRESPGAGLSVRVRAGEWRRLETAGRWWRVSAGGSSVRVVGWVSRDRLRPWDLDLDMRSVGSMGAGGGGHSVRFNPGPEDFCGLATVAAGTPLVASAGAPPWGHTTGATLAEVSHRHGDSWVQVWRIRRDADGCDPRAGVWVESRVPLAAVTFQRAEPVDSCTFGGSWRF
jgi:hypothetical protein